MSCEPLIDAAAASQIIGVCAKTVKRMAIRQEIPALKVGKYWKFRESLLDEWVKTQIQSAHSPSPSQFERNKP
jgi:excisionase family DNA binding protein